MHPLQIPVSTPSAVPDSIPSVQEELSMLKSMPLDDLMDKFVAAVTTFAINLAIAIVVFYVGRFVIKKLYKLVSLILTRRDVDQSLTTFVLSLIKMVLYFILMVTVIGILGIETSSFIAIFASAGVAIGMALSGTLQNFAGGVLILLLKPYKIGDYIEAQGFAGYVREIQIFHTIIATYDNKAIIIPNGGLSTGSINNWSREDYRRVEWEVAISYGDKVSDARDKILQIIGEDSRVVKRYIEDDRQMRLAEMTRRERAAAGKPVEPTPAEEAKAKADAVDALKAARGPWYKRIFHRHKKVVEEVGERVIRLRRRVPKAEKRPTVVVNSLADSSVVLKARAWTRTEFYWDVFYKINERIYNELPDAGINFPFPQLDVHMKQQ